MKADQQPVPVAAQVAALPNLPMDELWSLWDSYYRKRPGTWSRDYVASRLAYKIQEQTFGGIDPDIHRRLLRMGETQSKLGQRRAVDSQLLPGTVLLREWGETSYRVTVTPEGRFEMGGKVFKSLSAASRYITGTNWSGPRFFGLVQDSRSVR